MLSKNNKQEQNRRLEEKNNRFSIRKFTVGTASVLIGAFFMGVSGTQTVHAADTKSETTTVNVNTLEQAPNDNVNNSLIANVNLGDDLGLGDLLNNYNKQFGDKNQTNTGKEAQQDQQASTPSQSTQPATSSQDKKQDQQSDLDKATDNLVKDAVANLNKDANADAPKVEVKEDTRTVVRDVDVYLPGVDPKDEFVDKGYYMGTLNMDDMPQAKVTIDGKQYPTLWLSRSYSATSLADAMKGNNWTLADDGSEDHALPAEPGYTAKIVRVSVDALGGTEGIFEQTQRDEAKKLAAQLNAEIAKNPYELPAYSISSPLAVTFHVGYDKSTPVNAETRERVNVTLPSSTDPDEDYYYGSINTDANDMTGTKSADGKYTWTPVTHSAMSLDEALSGSNFVYAPDGTAHHTLPVVPGYRAKITDAEPDIAKNSSVEDNDEIEAEVEKLYSELHEKIAANPYEIPEYTTNLPLDVAFTIEYEKVSENGEVVDTPALPEAQVGIAGEPLTEDALPEARVGIAGEPLTEDALPEARVGIAGDPLTQDALPEAQVGIAGTPLTEDALSEAQVGIAGEPLTEDALPEAQVGIAGTPLTEAALPEAQVGVAGEPLVEEALPAYTDKLSTNGDAITVPALPEYNLDNQASASDSEPVVTPEATAEAPATVAPHATDAAETEVVDNNVVEDDTTAPVHSNEVSEDLSNHVAQADTTVAAKNEVNVDSNNREAKHEATLPQTGAKTTAAGVLGLMMVGVAAVVGLAIDRKRKN